MKKEYRLLYLLALLKLILPFLIQSPFYEPHRDEFLYLVEGRHLAWGFMEVPPLLSVLAWVTNAMGGSLFWIKIWPALGGAFTYLLVGRLILAFKGGWFAQILGWLPFVFGAYLRVQYLFEPNFLDIFFWTAMAYGLIRHGQTGKAGFLYLAGVSLGLGLLSKYSVLFFAVGLGLGLGLTPERKVLRDKHFYGGILLGLLLFLPNGIWQYLHGFPVVYHMRELQRSQLQYVGADEFLIGQIVFNLPCIFVWVGGLVYLGFTRAGKPYRFIAWAFVFVLILLVEGHGKDYYALGAYPVLFAFGAIYLERLTLGRRVYWRYAMVSMSLYMGIILVTIALPFRPPEALAAFYKGFAPAQRSGALRWEDQENHPLPQDFADMLSWKEMTKKVAKAYAILDSEERRQSFLFCDNYGEAGAVDYYGPSFHLPPVYSDNASFLYWLPADYSDFNVFILVTDDHHEMEHPFIHDFQSAMLVDSITNPYAREFGTYIILLKGPDSAFRKDFREKIERDKEKTTAGGTRRPPSHLTSSSL